MVRATPEARPVFRSIPVWGAVVLAAVLSACSSVPPACRNAPPANAVASACFAAGFVVFEDIGDGEGTIEVAYYADSDLRVRALVDRYGHEGGAPHVEAVFRHDVRGEANLFAIVSWELNHTGLGMVGRFYAVHAYRPGDAGLEPNALIVRNADIHTGIVGRMDGEDQDFEGATREGVVRLLSRLGLE